MKRVIQFILVLGILFFAYQFIVMLFVNQHEVTYKIEQDEKLFEIVETYQKDKNYENYVFKVTEGEHTFYFHNNSSLGKRDHIIQSFEVFLQDDLYCLYPVLEKETVTTDIICLKDNRLMTYTALKGENNTSINAFVGMLQNKGYQNPSFQTSFTSKEYRGKLIYQDNLLENETIALWDYQSLDVYEKDKLSNIDLLMSDRYENDFGFLIDSYYMIPNYDQTHDFNTMYIVDLRNHSKKSLYFDEDISYDSYVQGVVDQKYYLFDRSHKSQYEVNPKTNSYRLIGNIDLGGQYFDGTSWSSLPIGDFLNEKLIFPSSIPSLLLEKYPGCSIYEEKDRYYIIYPSGEVYLVYKDYLDDAIFLFRDDSMKSVIYKNGSIYYIKDNVLYRYSDYQGLKPLVSYNEFRYNHQNIYDVYLSSK